MQSFTTCRQQHSRTHFSGFLSDPAPLSPTGTRADRVRALFFSRVRAGAPIFSRSPSSLFSVPGLLPPLSSPFRLCPVILALLIQAAYAVGCSSSTAVGGRPAEESADEEFSSPVGGGTVLVTLGSHLSLRRAKISGRSCVREVLCERALEFPQSVRMCVFYVTRRWQTLCE